VTRIAPLLGIATILAGAPGCGGKSRAGADAGADLTDDASSTAPYAGMWDAARNDCPGGVYTELRDAMWSLRLTDTTYAEIFSATGCEATNAIIPLDMQGNHATVDLSAGAQSCVPSSCQASYSSTDTGQPTGVSYSILICPKQIPAGRTVDIQWSGDVLDYRVPGASCVQHFARRP
jgi:hypothetical protein